MNNYDPPIDPLPSDGPGAPIPGDDDYEYRAAALLAQKLANITQIPVSVVAQNGAYLIQDDADLDCYGGRADVVATYPPLAVTITSIAIEAAMLRNRLCLNCGEPHYGWQCPEIADALFAPEPAPWKDIALGRELCRMRWRNFQAFVALLLSVPADHLIIYARSYQAFIRDHSPQSDLTINDVLKVWSRIMAESGGRGPVGAALERAA